MDGGDLDLLSERGEGARTRVGEGAGQLAHRYLSGYANTTDSPHRAQFGRALRVDGTASAISLPGLGAACRSLTEVVDLFNLI